MNNHILPRYTVRDPSHFELFELMLAIFVIFVQIKMQFKKFNFRYWRQPIRMQLNQHELFALKLRCGHRYHLLSILRCQDHQLTTGWNHDHVTNSNITWLISATNWERKKRSSTQQRLLRSWKTETSRHSRITSISIKLSFAPTYYCKEIIFSFYIKP